MKIFKELIKKIIKYFTKIIEIIFNLIRYLNPYLFYYYNLHLRFSKNIQNRMDKKYPIIDNRIIYRKPQLKFTNKNFLVLDNNLYSPEHEVREDTSPYIDYFKTIEKTFNLKNINSFLDIGCSTGWVIHYLQQNYGLDVKGVEYFEYHKKFADDSVKEKILIRDLRTRLDIGQKFDIVNCTEVGEHIEPAAVDVFLENLIEHVNKYLIMTWSSTYPPKGAPPQHVSSLNYEDFVRLVESYGMKKNSKLTNELVDCSLEFDSFYFWWRDSITVFEK